VNSTGNSNDSEAAQNSTGSPANASPSQPPTGAPTIAAPTAAPTEEKSHNIPATRYDAFAQPAVQYPTTIKAITCATHLHDSAVTVLAISKLSLPVITTEALNRRAITMGQVSMTLTSTDATLSGFLMRYTVDGTDPACFGSSATKYDSSSKPTFSENVTVRAIACAAAMYPSDVVQHAVAIQASPPQISVVSTSSTHQVTLQSPNAQGTNFRMLYTLGHECDSTPDPTCSTAGGTAYDTTGGLTLTNGRFPLFYASSAYTGCIKAIACGDLMAASTVASQALSIDGEAPVFTHRVEAELTLLGYSVLAFDLTAQGMFARGVAAHTQVSENQVSISNITTSSATRRTESLKVAFHVDSPDSDTADSITNHIAAAQADASSLVSLLQAQGMSVSAVTIYRVSASRIVAPSTAPTQQPTTTAPTQQPTPLAPLVPTAAPTNVPAKKISQAVSFTTIPDANTYNTDASMKIAFEFAYGLGMGIVETVNGSMVFREDCEVSSAASRRAATVTFDAIVADHHAIEISASGISAANLASHISTVVASNPALANVPVPPASSMTVAPPVVTSVGGYPTPDPTLAPASEEDLKYVLYFGVAGICLTLLVLATLGLWQAGLFPGRGDDVLLLLEQVKPAFKAGAYVSSPKGGKGSSNIAYWTKHRAQALDALKKKRPEELAAHSAAFTAVAQFYPDDVGVRDGMAALCAKLPREEIEEHVVAFVSAKDWEMRKWAIEVLAHLPGEQLVPFVSCLQLSLQDSDAAVRQTTAQTVAHLPAAALAQLTEHLIPRLDDPAWPVQQEVAVALNLVPEATLQTYRGALESLKLSPNQHTRAIALQVLNRIPALDKELGLDITVEVPLTDADRTFDGAAHESPFNDSTFDRSCVGISPSCAAPGSLPPTTGPSSSVAGTSRLGKNSRARHRDANVPDANLSGAVSRFPPRDMQTGEYPEDADSSQGRFHGCSSVGVFL